MPAFSETLSDAKWAQARTPALALATDDLAEMVVFVSTRPAMETAPQYVFDLAWVPDGAIDGDDGSNFHNLILAKRTADGGTKTDLVTKAINDEHTAFAPVNLVVASLPLLTGEMLTLRSTHTGTPVEALPGGMFVVSLTPQDFGA